jgi:hypothetical protein
VTIYQALPDVHFRLSEEGQVIRCCGTCGTELGPGADDPCKDALTCWENQCNARIDGPAVSVAEEWVRLAP